VISANASPSVAVSASTDRITPVKSNVDPQIDARMCRSMYSPVHLFVDS
jgi:hypothetical protein